MAVDEERQPLLQNDHSPQSNNNNNNNVPHNCNPEQNDKPTGLITFRPSDPLNPLTWPPTYRWLLVFLLACQAFTVTFTCIGIVPIASRVVLALEGHTDKQASVLFVTIWELGEAAGPLVIGPLSERFGRYVVFNVANGLFICGIVITALAQDVGVVIFARFLTGCAVAGNVLGPAVVGDILPSEARGKGMSFIMLAPLLGGAVGPAIAGAIAETSGWREVLWMAVALAGACEVAFLLLFRETYAPAILRREAERLRGETGDERLRTEFDGEEKHWGKELGRAIVRPVAVLTSSSVLALMSVWGGLVFSFYYVMVTTLPDMLEGIYGFDAAETGSAFLSFSEIVPIPLPASKVALTLSPGVGSIVGIVVCNTLIDKIYLALRARRSPRSPSDHPTTNATTTSATYPEGRLPLLIFGALSMPLTIALYGLVPHLHASFWLLLLAVVITGFFEILCIVPLLTYVTDAFGLYSASALTAVLMIRCLMGTFLPLATAPLTEMLGYAWGFAILGAIGLGLAMVPLAVGVWGEGWRQRSRLPRIGKNR